MNEKEVQIFSWLLPVGGEGGLTSNGKSHEKFPYLFTPSLREPLLKFKSRSKCVVNKEIEHNLPQNPKD